MQYATFIRRWLNDVCISARALVENVTVQDGGENNEILFFFIRICYHNDARVQWLKIRRKLSCRRIFKMCIRDRYDADAMVLYYGEMDT